MVNMVVTGAATPLARSRRRAARRKPGGSAAAEA
jgi:hypothetical protein